VIEDYQKILSLIDYVKVNKFYVSCHFRCPVTKKTVISTVLFEPYEGKIHFKWYELLFSPLKCYKRYYHTPIVIYDAHSNNTIVLKAFEKVKKHFVWNQLEQKYVYKK
jgi:hypothetical protein